MFICTFIYVLLSFFVCPVFKYFTSNTFLDGLRKKQSFGGAVGVMVLDIVELLIMCFVVVPELVVEGGVVE